jgi:hypothetical protein
LHPSLYLSLLFTPPNHQHMGRIRPHLPSLHSFTLHTRITCLCMHFAPCG